MEKHIEYIVDYKNTHYWTIKMGCPDFNDVDECRITPIAGGGFNVNHYSHEHQEFDLYPSGIKKVVYKTK